MTVAGEPVQAVAPEVTSAGLREAVEAIHRMQLRSGEMPSYARQPGGTLLYSRSPLVSTFVHDALGCFDPRSPRWEERTLRAVDEAARGGFVWAVARLRRRLRAFIVWQAEPEGTWRFFGRGSGMHPDALTTAGSAAALLESPGRTARARSRRHVEAIERFRSPGGLYHTFVVPDQGGYGWWDESGRPVPGFEGVVNAEVLRFLTVSGARSLDEVAPLVRHLREEVALGDRRQASGLFPNPLCFAYAVARAWSQARLPGAAALAADLVPQVLARQDGSGGFGGPLSSALAVASLVDLGYEGAELDRGLAAVAGGRLPWGGWGYDDFVVGGYGSPAWTTALSMAALARAGAGAGGYGS